MTTNSVRTFGVFVTLALAAPPAHAQSVQEVLQQYGLLGIFSSDCAQPASKKNLYLAYRPIDGNRVQYDLMTGPTERANVGIIDAATALGPNEFGVSYSGKGGRLEIVYRRDGKRYRLWTSTRQNGEKLVANGRFTDDNAATPWLSRCG